MSLRSRRVTPLSLAGEPKLIATLLRGVEAAGNVRSRSMGFHPLAVDEDVSADDLDQDWPETALPDPTLHAVAGQGKRWLCVVGTTDDGIEGEGPARVHGRRETLSRRQEPSAGS